MNTFSTGLLNTMVKPGVDTVVAWGVVDVYPDIGT